MAAKNDITGDKIQTQVVTNEYKQGYDSIDWSARKREKASQEDSLIPPEPAEANPGLAG